jgi:hypothetical protein
MGLIGSGIGAAGAVFGGISASKAIKKMKRNIEDQRKKNQDWYDQRYNEDATQRADAQRVLSQTQDMLKRQTDAAAGSAAVGGGTDESVAQAKAQANDTLGNVMSNINAASDARKDEIEQTYQTNDNASVEQLNNLEQQKAKNIAKSVQGVTNAASKMPW